VGPPPPPPPPPVTFKVRVTLKPLRAKEIWVWREVDASLSHICRRFLIYLKVILDSIILEHTESCFNLFLNSDFLFSHQVLQIEHQFFKKATLHRVYTFTELTIWFALAS